MNDQTPEPFGFTVKRGTVWDYAANESRVAPGMWVVSLPHQCDRWDIAGYDGTGEPHARSVELLEAFISEAQSALEGIEGGAGDRRRRVVSEIVELAQPKAKVIESPGFNRVYGWREELVTERGSVPLSGLVSVHSFAWTARRAMRRWLEAQKALHRGMTSKDVAPLPVSNKRWHR